MKECKSCKKPVAFHARVCYGCGQPWPAPRKTWPWLVAWIAVFYVVAVVVATLH